MMDQVIAGMKAVFAQSPAWIDHTLGVLADAEVIADGEGLAGRDRELVQVTAILHDIGAVAAQARHGSTAAKYQEMEGPGVARALLAPLGYDDAFIDRVCYIVGHHHTFPAIDGLDFQIQWEADMLTNLAHMAVRSDPDTLRLFLDKNFATKTGHRLAVARYLDA